jgi:hypothetical protein
MERNAMPDVQDVRAGGASAARSETLGRLGRAGLVARGVIYAIVGVLAVKLALGDGGEATNQQGALRTIAEQPFGKGLLVLTAIGLLGYASWRLIRAAVGHGREATDDTKDRIAGAASGIAYAILFFTAVRILTTGGGGSGGSGQAQQATGGVLDWPGGPWIVGIAGLVLIGVGLDQGRKGVTQEFLEDSKTGEMTPRVRKAFTAVGVFGHVARMVVFGVIGWFLIKAAIDYDPDQAVSLDGALSRLGQASYGPMLLGVVAAGLVGFAVYSVLDARYRRV